MNRIIAAELPIDAPNIETFNVATFLEETLESYSMVSKVEPVYLRRNGRAYPWDRRIIMRADVPFVSLEKYPELTKIVALARSMMIDANIIMLYQRDQLKGYDFHFHFDSDYPHGYRVCYGLDTTNPFLEFSRLKDEYLVDVRNADKVEPHMVEPEVFQFIPSKTNTVLRINGDYFPHRVPINGSTNRLVFVITGKPKDFAFGFIQELTLNQS